MTTMATTRRELRGGIHLTVRRCPSGTAWRLTLTDDGRPDDTGTPTVVYDCSGQDLTVLEAQARRALRYEATMNPGYHGGRLLAAALDYTWRAA